MVCLLTVLGARPQFIKASTLSRHLRQHSIEIEERILHTGQHYDTEMSKVFFDELNIPLPHYELEVGSHSHAHQTARMLMGIEDILIKENFDAVLVYGDTNSTLAGALAAAKLHVPVVHVEAGLRSYNRQMPEEINRTLTDQLSDMHFCPSVSSIDNLDKENISGPFVINSGDIMLEGMAYYKDIATKKDSSVDALALNAADYVLTTIHRAENTDEDSRLTCIVQALCNISSQLQVVFPIHPRTKARLQDLGLLSTLDTHCKLIPPIGLLGMINLISNAQMIITDSGGLQKEAYFLGKPCAVIRSETEWTELVDLGWVHLCSAHDQLELSSSILSVIGKTGDEGSPYGNGKTSEIIAHGIERFFA
jgi:UDP-GlcNAc3NAcA epimerase